MTDNTTMSKLNYVGDKVNTFGWVLLGTIATAFLLISITIQSQTEAIPYQVCHNETTTQQYDDVIFETGRPDLPEISQCYLAQLAQLKDPNRKVQTLPRGCLITTTTPVCHVVYPKTEWE